MSRIDDGPLARLSTRQPRHSAHHLLGGTMILLVWLALWAWLAVGVVRPLSTMPSLRTSAAAAAAERA